MRSCTHVGCAQFLDYKIKLRVLPLVSKAVNKACLQPQSWHSLPYVNDWFVKKMLTHLLPRLGKVRCLEFALPLALQ